MNPRRTEKENDEGTNSIVDIIIQGVMGKAKDNESAISILRADLQKKLDSEDPDKNEYASWYYLALSKLRGDKKLK